MIASRESRPSRRSREGINHVRPVKGMVKKSHAAVTSESSLVPMTVNALWLPTAVIIAL
jgi:hypothetical protein